jgi:2'-deoxynucleoside 5'-phosphate N-hydrolase
VKIYFAASIRGGRGDWESYLEIAKLLGRFGTVLTEHIGDAALSERGEDIGDALIHDRDLGWLKESDCLVAEVTTPSLGVGYEIGKATEWQKPVLCLFRPIEGRSLSAMISGCPGLVVKEYERVEQLPPIIEQFFSEHQASSAYK